MAGSEEKLQKTVLAERHREFGARMAEFAGWYMPIRYPQGILHEHLHTRKYASLFDVCHMGEIQVTGVEAAVFLDRLLPRKSSDLEVGRCRYNFLLTPEGTIKDDLIVYRLAVRKFLLVVNAGTRHSDYAWLQQNCKEEIRLEDVSDRTAKLDLQGPQTLAVLRDCGMQAADMPQRYAWSNSKLFGHDMLISGTGYTGEIGVEMYMATDAADMIWQKLLQHEKVAPAGLAARDTLRLEMGYPLYGHELNEQITPVEAGFARLLRNRRSGFIGAEALQSSPDKSLCGFCLQGRRAARPGMKIWNGQHEVQGFITSGAYAPSVGKALAMGYVKGSVPDYGTSVLVGTVPAKSLQAEVCKRPFLNV